MPTIISRAQAGIPPMPSSVGTRSLSSWTGIKVHHTGGAFSSWRAIYDWQVLNRPVGERLVDVGYSFGVANGRVTELRGWTRHPAHDHENSTIGVVLGGNYQNSLPPEEDLAALVWFCQEARRRTGKQLAITGHRDTWPRSDGRYSSCPGDRLYAYLPTLRTRVDADEEDDMPTVDEIVAGLLSHTMSSPSQGVKDRRIAEWLKVAASAASDTAALRQEAAAARLRDEAILAAVNGGSAEEILARIDQRADEEAARDQQARDELVALLEQASVERAEIAELIGQAASGQLSADEVVRLIGEKLTAAGAEG